MKRLVKAKILGLDEACVNFKKTSGYGLQQIEKVRNLIGFEVCTRDTRHSKNLSEKTSYVDPKKYASSRYTQYNLIDCQKGLLTKHTILLTSV